METDLDVFFYEAFEEEEQALKRLLPPGLRAGFIPSTIQEHGDPHPPAPLISIRTQSEIPANRRRASSILLTYAESAVRQRRPPQ